MAERTMYELLLSLQGTADPSLQNAFNKAKAEMLRLEQATKKMNTALGGISTTSRTSAQSMMTHFGSAARSMVVHARTIGAAWAKAGAQIRSAMHPVTGPLHSLGHVTGIGAGLGAVGAAFGAEELGRSAWEVHASRETARVGLETILKNRGMGGQTKAFEDMILRLTSDETKTDYGVALKAAQLMMNSGKIGSAEEVHTFLTQMAALGGTSEANQKGMMAISKMLAEGRIEGRHMNELISDLPSIPWFADIAKVMGLKGGTAEMRKKMATPGTTIDSDVIQKVLAMETGPGGKLFGMNAALMASPEGLQSRMGARWKILEDTLGKIESDAVVPLLTRITGDIDVEKLSHALDAAADASERFGKEISSAYGVLKSSGALSETGRLLGDIAGKMGAAFGVNGSNSVEVMTSAWNKMNDALRWINDHFKDIVGWMKLAIESWIAIQAWKIGSGIVSAIGTLGGALIGLKGAAAGAKVEMSGLAAAEEAASFGLGGLATLAALPVGSALMAKFLSDKYGLGKYFRGGSDIPQVPGTTGHTEDVWLKSDKLLDQVEKHLDPIDEGWKAIFKTIREGLTSFQNWDPSDLRNHVGHRQAVTPGYGLPQPGPNAQGFPTFQQYGTEGPSSNFHNGKQLTQDDSNVGIGGLIRQKYGLRDGDKVHIPGMGWRTINEKSSRVWGVEFFKDRPGSGKPIPERLKIDKVQKSDAPVINVSYAPTINGAGDTRGIATTLHSHSEELSRMLRDAIREDSRLSYA